MSGFRHILPTLRQGSLSQTSKCLTERITLLFEQGAPSPVLDHDEKTKWGKVFFAVLVSKKVKEKQRGPGGRFYSFIYLFF